jgi:hypothetical protein
MRTNNEILTDYLDKHLIPEEISRIDCIMETDPVMAADMEYLKLAISTVRIAGVSNQVSAIRASMNKNSSANTGTAVVRTMYKMTMRVAAVLMLLIGSAVLYKYVSVNDQTFYNRQFAGYELGSSRGVETNSAEVEAYQNKKWNTVIAIYNGQHANSNKPGFLAAMAQMQLHHFPQAVSIFENIIQNGSADQSFREESEYYLALAYIMNHEVEKSIPIINKIKANPEHTYYPLVSKFSSIDLKIIELKKK